MISRILAWGLGVVVVSIILGVSYRAHAQQRVARTLVIDSPNGIDEGLFMTVGGLEQWVQIRGEDRANPVILMLHGGPGMSYVPFASYFRAWEKHFTIVQWDRRGVGKTYGKNGESPGITLALLAKDGVELADSLRKRFGKDKLILVGHSVGSVVGVLMASQRPDLFHAYVGTDQIAGMASNEAVSYRMLRERARSLADEKLKSEIEALEAPPYTNADRWFEKQRLISATDPIARSFENNLFKLIATAPGYSMSDMMALGKGLKFSAAALLSEMMTFDGVAKTTRFEIPVFLFEGENDVLDPTELAVAWFNGVSAPTKEQVIFGGAGHNAVLMQSDRFLAELIKRVRPLAARAQ